MLTKLIVTVCCLSASFGCGGFLRADEAAPKWRLALPGLHYQFPADHAIHPDFKTEWWYFTGNLRAKDGHAYGYELTFFRQGIIPPGQSTLMKPDNGGMSSRFVQNDFKFAHFAISDLDRAKFVYTQKISRGAFGEAGFDAMRADPAGTLPAEIPKRLAWIENWSLQPQADGSWRIVAQADTSPPMSINLVVTPGKPPIIEGTNGVSQKSAGAGNASYYYSLTRLKTAGVLTLGEADAGQAVQGESWFDHEWASNQLAADQVGWNWFCFQFDDQTELMLYAMRRRDGSVDPESSGTLIHPDGTTEHLPRDQFQLRPLKTWQSRKTGATYPVGWQISIPSHQLNLTVGTRLEDQELVLPPISYWEGAIEATGENAGRAIKGVGYMELTGYAAPLKGLQQASAPEADLRAPAH